MVGRMATGGAPAGERASRGRRGTRTSADDRERAILETAEHLLETRGLGEISTGDLARGAGISRSSFYFYFASKDAVLLSLLDRVTAEADAAREAALAEAGDGPLAEVCRLGVAAFHETFRAHRAVTLAAADARATLPEVREQWARVMEGWVRDTEALIAAERPAAPAMGAAGAAEAARGVPARDLAVALNLMNERVLHASFAGEAPAVGEDAVVDALVAVWVAAIRGPADA
jgi:AcrR family transcriptional regulator